MQKTKNRQGVCPRSRTAAPGMRKAGRTYCDEYPFASTYQGGTKLPAPQRETTWVSPNENNTQGARITNWRRAERNGPTGAPPARTGVPSALRTPP
ncbi:NucA/NucB deoxyribonuclease domain-containing protein [Streptomyces griseofuscus]